MEVCVDDMLVKIQEESIHVDGLEDYFKIIKEFNIRLNLKKCALAMMGGKYLGNMVTRKEIKPNPEKVKAILDMQLPISTTDAQRLTGRLAALNRFLSKSTDHVLHFL